MSTDTSIKLSLYQSVGGLAVEISGLPVIGGPEHIAIHRKYEIAAEALRQQYPELVIAKWVDADSDSMIFWVTNR